MSDGSAESFSYPSCPDSRLSAKLIVFWTTDGNEGNKQLVGLDVK